MYDKISHKKAVNKLVTSLLFTASFLTIFITAGIVYVLLTDTIKFFRFPEVSLFEFLTGTEWTPVFVTKKFGVLPLVAGTFLTAGIATLISVPLGLLIAVYLSEYVSGSIREIVKPMIEFLEAIPTVVYGYFALLFLTPLLQKFIPELQGLNALAPGIVIGIMVLPYTASLSEDALRGVPQELREAAYALGDSRLNTAFRVVLPAAISGVMAAFILGISRALGETMVVAIAAGIYPNLTLNPLEPIETITAYIVQISLGDLPFGTIEYLSIFAVGFTLFVITLIFNTLAFWFKSKIRETY
jgi:phosphate transport system permease protein